MLFMLHLVGVAVYYDVRYRRIPNGLIVVGLLMGLVYQVRHFRLAGLAAYGAGVLFPVAVLGFLYYFRMMGAGDIKLLSVIGGFLGPFQGFLCIIYTFLIGGAIAVALLFKRRIFFKRIHYFRDYVFQYLQTRQWSPYMQPKDEEGSLYFSIPVFISLFCFWGVFIDK